MNISKTAINVLGKWVLCDNCLGRIWAQLLSGTSNKERGKTIRRYVAMLIDSGEKIEINEKNLYGIKLRNFKNVTEKEECYICKNFFEEKIYEFAKKVLEESKKIEFKTFLIGSIIPQYMTATEEKVWEEVDIEGVESIKSEINREIGKIVKKLTGKNFEQKNPDVTFIVDLNKGKIKTEIRSLYVFGEYKKLSRGIPQTKWVCSRCKGKGCEHCRGKGKLYPTSVQEIIEKPFLKYCKSEKTRFSGAGREDIDARCLDWRPFVIEILRPLKRSFDLKKIETEINKSKKVKVRKLKFTEKYMVRKLKTERMDKSYVAVVDFYNKVEKKRLKELKKIIEEPISQKTPLRVLHRRVDKIRKRRVKNISWKLLTNKRVEFKIMAESGLYIKEFITGDEGRTKPSISEIIENKVKNIKLDVIKIHSKIRV